MNEQEIDLIPTGLLIDALVRRFDAIAFIGTKQMNATDINTHGRTSGPQQLIVGMLRNLTLREEMKMMRVHNEDAEDRDSDMRGRG